MVPAQDRKRWGRLTWTGIVATAVDVNNVVFPGENITLRVDVFGTTYKAYINGILVSTFVDSTETHGQIGLYDFYSGLSFDNAQLTIPGLIGNDSVSGLAEVYTNANAGSSKTLSVSTYTINDGNGGKNYTVTTVNSTTGVINKAPLTLTAPTYTKTYDSTASVGAFSVNAATLASSYPYGTKWTRCLGRRWHRQPLHRESRR